MNDQEPSSRPPHSLFHLASRAALVSGDRHLLGLARDIPVLSPAAFLSVIEGERGPKGA